MKDLRLRIPALIAPIALAFFLASAVKAEQVAPMSRDLDFLEAFVWGDRAAALQRLAPNTDEWFFYHALAAQLAGDGARFDEIFGQWLRFHRQQRTEVMRALEARMRLSRFAQDPDSTWAYLQEHVRLSHARRASSAPPDRPTVIRPGEYALERFLEPPTSIDALHRYADRGLLWVLKPDLPPRSDAPRWRAFNRRTSPGLPTTSRTTSTTGIRRAARFLSASTASIDG